MGHSDYNAVRLGVVITILVGVDMMITILIDGGMVITIQIDGEW